MNWLTEMMTNMISDWINDIVNVFFEFIEGIFQSAEHWINAGEVEQGIMITTLVASSFVGLLICKNILDTYILETNGDSDTDPLQTLVNCSIAIALINCGGVICKFLLSCSNKLSKSFIENMEVKYDNLGEALVGFIKLSSPAVTALMFIYVIMLIIFLFRAVIRGAELALMKILFPIFACDFVTQSRERWNAFFMSYIVVIFGYCIQLFAFRLSITSFLMSGLDNQLYGMGFLWMAITTPKWLEKFVYKSGLGQKAGRGAMSAAYVLPRFIGR